MIRYCELAILLVVIMQVSSNSAIESVCLVLLKVLVENTKKELSRIQAELSSTNRNLNFS
jgi:hypothetical protein